MRISVGVWFFVAFLMLASPARAGVLQVDVTVAGNNAHANIELVDVTLAELHLGFDDASNLTPQSLGINAQLVSLTDALLRLRLPNLGAQTPLSALALLITVEPPAQHGLNFRNTVRTEIHTHLLPYRAGSRLRIFKAPLLGQFRDITDEVAPGSVRTRGTTGGFSQFLILIDLRSTSSVIATKISQLRAITGTLPLVTRAPLEASIDDAEDAVAEARYADAITAVDTLRAQVSAGAGTTIPNVWSTSNRNGNKAGDLLGGASSLKFSIGYLRDYGN